MFGIIYCQLDEHFHESRIIFKYINLIPDPNKVLAYSKCYLDIYSQLSTIYMSQDNYNRNHSSIYNIWKANKPFLICVVLQLLWFSNNINHINWSFSYLNQSHKTNISSNSDNQNVNHNVLLTLGFSIATMNIRRNAESERKQRHRLQQIHRVSWHHKFTLGHVQISDHVCLWNMRRVYLIYFYLFNCIKN